MVRMFLASGSLLANQAAVRNSSFFQQQLSAPESGGSPALHGSGVNRSWSYDRAYNVSGIEDGLWGNTHYQYDLNDQVIRAHSGGCLPCLEQFSYDANQNLSLHGDVPRGADGVLQQALQYQQGGRVICRGNVHYRYDAAGRLVEKKALKEGFRPQVWRYRWNE